MTQVALSVLTSEGGLVYTKPSLSVQLRHEQRIADAVCDVFFELPILILVVNLTTKLRTLPESTAIAYAKRGTFARLAFDDELSQGVKDVLYMSEYPSATGECVQSKRDSSPTSLSTNGERCKLPPNEGSATASDWHSQISLSHMKCEQMRARLLDMLAWQAIMWNGVLGTLRPTDQRIDHKERSSPSCTHDKRMGVSRCPTPEERWDASLLCGLSKAQQVDAIGRVSHFLERRLSRLAK